MSKLQQIIMILIAAALGLPIVMCVVVGLASLLSAMSDVAGAAALHRVGLALAIVWVTGLIGLLIAVAIRSLDQRE